VLIELGGDQGAPDGLTVDHEGCLWVAVYGRWEVRRYTPLEELLERVPIPAAQVTCCCFGGPEGSTLFVTTAREGSATKNRESSPRLEAYSRFPPGCQHHRWRSSSQRLSFWQPSPATTESSLSSSGWRGWRPPPLLVAGEVDHADAASSTHPSSTVT
jgi:hypothetical protein